MSTRHQEILLGVAVQRFTFDVVEGRPDADPVPGVTVYDATSDDDDTPEAATTGIVAIEAVDTTLSANATAGDVTITVVDPTSIARRRQYLLGIERVEVIGIAGSELTLRRPLLNDADAGATFESTRISIAVDATWSSDDVNLTDCELGAGYRLRWTYTVDGIAYVGVSYADLVRYSSQNLVTALDVDDRFPGFIDRLPPDNRENQGETFIREAFDQVRFDALGDAQVLRRMRDTFVLGELVKAKANVIAIENQVMRGGANMLDALKTARDTYDKRYQQLIREPKVPVDQSGDGAAQPARRLPLLVR